MNHTGSAHALGLVTAGTGAVAGRSSSTGLTASSKSSDAASLAAAELQTVANAGEPLSDDLLSLPGGLFGGGGDDDDDDDDGENEKVMATATSHSTSERIRLRVAKLQEERGDDELSSDDELEQLPQHPIGQIQPRQWSC